MRDEEIWVDGAFVGRTDCRGIGGTLGEIVDFEGGLKEDCFWVVV